MQGRALLTDEDATAGLRAVAVLLLLIVTVLSLLPNPPEGGAGGVFGAWLSRLLTGSDAYGDKAAHAFAYLATAGATGAGFGQTGRRLLGAAAGLFAWSLVLEGLQAAGGARTGDAWDALANLVGIVGGTVLALGFRRAVRAFGLPLR